MQSNLKELKTTCDGEGQEGCVRKDSETHSRLRVIGWRIRW